MLRSVFIVLVLFSIGCAGQVSVPPPLRPVSWPADQLEGQLTDTTTVDTAPCSDRALISTDSLGPIAPGWTVVQVLARCPHVIAYWDWGDEGVPQPALALRAGGSVIRVMLEDTLPGSRVERLLTTSVLAQTVEGIGPGRTLDDLERVYGPLTFGNAECAIYAWTERLPGVSWILTFPPGWDCIRASRVDLGTERPPGTVQLFEAIVFHRAPN